MLQVEQGATTVRSVCVHVEITLSEEIILIALSVQCLYHGLCHDLHLLSNKENIVQRRLYTPDLISLYTVIYKSTFRQLPKLWQADSLR